MQATTQLQRPSRSLRFHIEMTMGEIVRTYLLNLLPDQDGNTYRCRLVGHSHLCAGQMIDCGINAAGPYCLTCTNPSEKPCAHVKALIAARVLPQTGTTAASIEEGRKLLQEQQLFFEARVADLDEKLRNMQIALDAANSTAARLTNQAATVAELQQKLADTEAKNARLTAEAIDLRRQRRELDDDLMRSDDERNQVEAELTITRAALADRPAPRTRRTRKAATSAA